MAHAYIFLLLAESLLVSLLIFAAIFSSLLAESLLGSLLIFAARLLHIEMDDDNEDLQQYESILALEQERWIPSEWNEPEEVSFTQQTSQDATGDSSGSEDGSRGGEDSVPSSSRVDNPYVQQLWDGADLHILRPGKVRQAIAGESPQLALFNLFMTRTFLDAVWSWTNESLEKKGRKKCTKAEFKAYVGLEMGMSLLRFNDIKKYWATGSFLGSETFRTTMSRDRFISIRSCICFRSPTSYDADEANDDPLWTCRSLLDNFIKRGASVAVPLGVSALDECTCATKARSRAKTYLPIKPDKYGIRFYAVVSHRYCYISSFFDNKKPTLGHNCKYSPTSLDDLKLPALKPSTS